MSCRCSLTAGWTLRRICESQRLVLSQVMMIRGGDVAELLCGSLNLGSDDTIEYLPSGDKPYLQFPNAY